jgi:hypothetical protein
LAVTFLLLEEYFATGDDRFAEAIRDFHVPGTLASLTDKWKKDPRPWARGQVLKYLDESLTSAGHETVVKRLFKHFEEVGDDQVMGAFAVAFDRLVRRKLKKHREWDFRTRQVNEYETLATQRDAGPPRQSGKPVVPSFKPVMQYPGTKLFSYHTRYYLRRRAWRYFRYMGHRKPGNYPKAVAEFLKLYRDADLERGENILDCWSLVHACFGESDVIAINGSHVNLSPGRALRELNPAPAFAELWKSETSGSLLVDLLLTANSRLVRVWAMGLLQRDHLPLLGAMSVADIRRLLDHPDEQVQVLGAQALENSTRLGQLTVDEWLELLAAQNPTVLETISGLMEKHVRGDRLNLEQVVQLASARAVPVVRLGFGFLKNRQIAGEQDLETIARLAEVQSASVAAEITRWALERLGASSVYRVERISRFFDSLIQQTREAAWDWLTPTSAGWNDAALWSRLIETPYDDVRLHFVSALEARTKAPGMVAGNLAGIWASVLMGIQRGGRHKLIALRQISRAAEENPGSIEMLLPVLAVAIRSVRPPEARGGLAAIVGAVEARPELATVVERVIPELVLSPREVA